MYSKTLKHVYNIFAIFFILHVTTVLLINGIDVTILLAGLAKRSKEISCSRNLVAARDFYDARGTFYASSYENLIEKSARHAGASTLYRGGSGRNLRPVWLKGGENSTLKAEEFPQIYGSY